MSAQGRFARLHLFEKPRSFHPTLSNEQKGVLIMNMRWVVITACACMTTYALAQEGASKEEIEREKAFRDRAAKLQQDTVKVYGWTHTLVTGVNLTQVSFKDWVQGGTNALAYTAWVNGSFVQDMEKTNWANTYKLAFGQTRLGDQGLRKTDDEIYFESLLIYKQWTSVNPYLSVTLRTQFASGFNYDDHGNKTEVSRFFDPAYATQSLGAAYKPIPEVTTRIGVALREVVTSDFFHYSDDPSTLGIEKVKVSGGLESVTDVEWKFAENMLLASRLELFAPFKTLDEMIVRSDNALSAKVNKYVTVSFNVQLINDVTVTKRTQIKQVLAIGVSYSLL
jgi:hypothetical protein